MFASVFEWLEDTVVETRSANLILAGLLSAFHLVGMTPLVNSAASAYHDFRHCRFDMITV